MSRRTVATSVADVTANNTSPSIQRRTVAKAALWAAPTVIVSASAPAFAASMRKDPGINGWVNNSYGVGRCGSSSSSISVTSRGTGGTPDGAPFGLYLYDTDDVTTVTDASLTYWILGEHPASGRASITWSSGDGMSSCWVYQGRVASMQKPDGLTYTGYRWNYTCPIDPRATTTGSDGIKRVFLGDFVVSTSRFEQPAGSCGKLNFWTERAVTIDGQPYTFQRRAGTDGSFPQGSRARSLPAAPEGDGASAGTDVS